MRAGARQRMDYCWRTFFWWCDETASAMLNHKRWLFLGIQKERGEEHVAQT
jgi:hypothetical protein